MEKGMLQATGYPAEIAEGVFLVAKIVRLVMGSQWVVKQSSQLSVSEIYLFFSKDQVAFLYSIRLFKNSCLSSVMPSWTSTVLTLRFLPFKQLAPNLCCRQSLAGTRIISKRKRKHNLHMSFWERKLELTLWLCGRRAQSTSLITN